MRKKGRRRQIRNGTKKKGEVRRQNAKCTEIKRGRGHRQISKCTEKKGKGAQTKHKMHRKRRVGCGVVRRHGGFTIYIILILVIIFPFSWFIPCAPFFFRIKNWFCICYFYCFCNLS